MNPGENPREGGKFRDEQSKGEGGSVAWESGCCFSRPLGWFRASALRKLFVFRLGLAHIKRVGLVGRDTWLVMSGEHRCLVLEW